MKNIVVFTAVLILLACVIPMAQANNPQPEDANVSSEKTEEQSTQSDETIEFEQQQKHLQAIQLLKAKLQQLQFEQQTLQKELQALMLAKDKATQAKNKALQASKDAETAKSKAAKASVKTKAAKDKAAKAKVESKAQRAAAEAQRWEHWASQWVHSEAFKQWQKEMEEWAKEQAKVHEKARSSATFPTPTPNPQPRPMPPMPAMPPMPSIPVEVEVKTDVDLEIDEVDVDVDVVDTPEVVVPTPPVPPTAVPTPPSPLRVSVPTPPMPPAPLSVPVPTAPTPPTPPSVPAPPTVIAPTPTLPAPPSVAAPTSSPSLLGTSAETVEPALTLPGLKPEPDREVKISKDKDGKVVATTEMHFISKVKPGSPFIVRNILGNITLLPSKDGTCDVRAIIRAKAETAAKAEEMVLQVGMNVHSSEDKYYLKPVKANGGKWNNLSVDFIITIPSGVRPDVKTELGNIKLSNLQGEITAVSDMGKVELLNLNGQIKAVTNMGSIKAVHTTGNLDLFAKMGDIEFMAPRDLSARLQVENKMGSIKSELPLNVSKVDMFKSTAEGTLGTGKGNIRIHTDMGSIRLKWQPVPEEVPISKPSPSDAARF